MKHFRFSTAGLAALLLVSACDDVGESTQGAEQAGSTGNILLAEWSGPYGGVPAFDKMDLADLKPALEEGMVMNLAEINVIVSDPEPPTFANTIAALEGSGRDLDRALNYWRLWIYNLSSPEFREIRKEMAPKLSAFNSKIIQNQALFLRIRSVYEGSELETLRPDQKRLTKIYYDFFARGGAALQGMARDRHAAINLRLAELQTQFSLNVLADQEAYVTYLNKDQLAGLPQSFVEAAAATALSRGHEGEFAVTNSRSSMDGFLTFSDERDLRETVWRIYYSRGDNGDQNDNNAIISEILQLRHERVKLLGYDNYAQWRLDNRMARTPARALELLKAVWPAAIGRVNEEVADMQAVADAEGAGVTIAPWDYRYFGEKVRKAKYDLDSDEVKQYLQLDKLREAMFFVAGELFNYGFAAVEEGKVPVFHEDVRVWEVTNKSSGEYIGLWYLDPFARPGKRSGAWATSYRSHETFDGKKTVLASTNSNFVKPAPGTPALVSWDEAEVFFHEFGHALHFFSSNVVYPTLNGGPRDYGGVRDYTEFHSQLIERWVMTDEVISKYLVHHETGQPMPAELVEKIKTAAVFNQGFATTENIASAFVDLYFHTVDPENIDPDAFERQVLETLGMPEQVVMRYRSPHFQHIFSSESYSAAYYGYLWADVLSADAAEAFAEAPGGYYDKNVTATLIENLYAPRNAVDPVEAYRAFRGRDAGIDALMRHRGFALTSKSR